MSDFQKNSEQLWVTYRKLLAPLEGEIQTPTGWFFDSVWTDFDAQAVLQFLIDPRPSFPGHKEVVFAAWVGWVTGGANKTWVRTMAVRAVADFMVKAERRAMRRYDKYGIAAEIVARYHEIGARFLAEIYYPIGGVKTLRRYRSDKAIEKRSFLRIRNTIEEVRILLQYFHSAMLLENKNQTPSINDAKLIKTHLGISSDGKFSAIWARHRSRASLIYAASLTPVDESNLLEKMLSEKSGWQSLRHHLADFTSLAAGVNASLLCMIESGSTVSTTLLEENRATLPSDTVERAVPPITVGPKLQRHFTVKPLEIRKKKAVR